MRLSSLTASFAVVLAAASLGCGTAATRTARVDEVQVSVQPKVQELDVNATLLIQASVTGVADATVTWSVLEPEGGTVDAAGTYTAPDVGGTYHVVARLAADSGKHDTSEISVKGPVSVSPSSRTLDVNGTATFSATVKRNGNTGVDWSVREVGGGTVTAGGVYTAPAVPGTYHVVATSQADHRQTASAVATVVQPVPVAVTVTPGNASLTFGQTFGFSAAVGGSTDTAVVWSVAEAGGGSVTSGGVYTAPSAAGIFHVVATAHADGSKTATATVTVAAAPAVSVTVNPESIAITTSQTATFAATVVNATDTSVTWSVAEASGGSVSQAGVYQPPAVAGIYHVVATSHADASRSAFATVGVRVPAAVAVSVNPTTLSLTGGQSFALAASVTNSTDAAVTWSVTEAGGGSVTSAGVYTAPSGTGTYHVVATSHADPTKAASCLVTVTAAPVVSVVVSPASTTVRAGQSATFSATVLNATDTAVAWTITEGSGGSITSAGVYTAPASAGTYHVVATSLADGTRSATATVVVTPQVSVTISPTSLSLTPGQSQAFGAAVANSTDTAVTWSVTEAGGGSVTAAGVYTAPASAGTYHVVAAAHADATRTATATVTVAAAPVIGVSINPKTVSLTVNQTTSFSAVVTNTSDTSVVWSVQEGGGGSVSGGVYTAPATPGTYHVVAAAHADPGKTDSATVTVAAAPVVAISISPTSKTLTVGQGATFTATVVNAANTTVSWSVTEAGGGSVTAGAYTAPAAPGTYHLVATANADSSKTATAVVTVLAASGSLADQLALLATREISFGHQSVGSNIMAGVQALLDGNAGAEPVVASGRTAGDLAPGRFTQWGVGVNEYPNGKIDDFSAVITAQGAALNAAHGIAFMKYCFVDFYDSAKDVNWNVGTDAANTQTLFNHYKSAMASLKAAFPNVTIVHFTAPLVRTDPYPYRSNDRRERYSDLVRTTYAGQAPVFDLAKLESTRPDGTRCTITNASAGPIGTAALCPEYAMTDDDGHLNATGKDVVARALIALLASLP